MPTDSDASQLLFLEHNPLVTELHALGSVYQHLQRKDNWQRQAPEQIFIIGPIVGAWQLLD